MKALFLIHQLKYLRSSSHRDQFQFSCKIYFINLFRVGINKTARAILNNPNLILADEPTGNLDPATSSEIMELILDINSKGSTILMATHDYNVISTYPKKTLRVENGKLFELSKKT